MKDIEETQGHGGTMRGFPLVLLGSLLVSCSEGDLLGPTPGPGLHLTAQVDGMPFVANVPAGRCAGIDFSSSFFISVRAAGQWPTPSISLHLGGVTAPGLHLMKPDEVQARQVAALYIPGDPALLQYSAVQGKGAIQIDEYHADTGEVAGRFYFDAVRAVGSTGPQWVSVRQGSFRVRLDDPSLRGCP